GETYSFIPSLRVSPWAAERREEGHNTGLRAGREGGAKETKRQRERETVPGLKAADERTLGESVTPVIGGGLDSPELVTSCSGGQILPPPGVTAPPAD
ncbi:hypothetical protein KUCAC02_017197, partial [Chaenocephalus aceratus]